MKKNVKKMITSCLGATLVVSIQLYCPVAGHAAEFTDGAEASVLFDSEFVVDKVESASEDIFLDEPEEMEETEYYGDEYGEEEISGYFIYRVNKKGEIKITEYAGTEAYVNVPTEIKGKPVLKVGYNAFGNGNNVVSVNMPSVTEVDSYAFHDCENLQSVSGPGVKVVGEKAFSTCSALKSIEIPQVKEIGYSAFENCRSLSNISLPNLKKVEDDTFRNCVSLEWVDISCATSIGKSAFADCLSLKEISIINSREIGLWAFENCCSLEKIQCPQVKYIGPSAFNGCTSLNSVELSDDLECVEFSAFFCCDSLKYVVLYDELKEIGEHAFGYLAGTEKMDEFKIHCEEGSKANMYAVRNGFALSFHQYSEKLEKKASFGEDGYYEQVCDECGYVKKQSKIPGIKTIDYSSLKFDYNGKIQKPMVTVYDMMDRVIDPKYYTVEYSADSILTGEYEVSVTFKELYEGSTEEEYYIYPPLQTISVSDKTITMGGSPVSLGAKITKGNGKLTYKSGNTKVVTVSSKGTLTPKGIGRTTITVVANETSDYRETIKKITVTVIPQKPSITRVDSSAGKLTVNWNKATDAHGYVLYRTTGSNGAYKKIAIIRDEGTTSYTNSGLEGNKRYYYKLRSYKKVDGRTIYSDYSSTRSRVTRPLKETNKLNRTVLQLSPKQTYTLKVGTNKTVKWSSSNSNVVAVSSSGKVTAKRSGTAIITAEFGDRELTCKVGVLSEDKVYSIQTNSSFLGKVYRETWEHPTMGEQVVYILKLVKPIKFNVNGYTRTVSEMHLLSDNASKYVGKYVIVKGFTFSGDTWWYRRLVAMNNVKFY